MIPRLFRIVQDYALPTLLAFCILWKGGKSLEATWLLVGCAALLTYVSITLQKGARCVPWLFWCCFFLFVLATVFSYFQSSTGNYGLDEVFRDSSYFLIVCWILREMQINGSALTNRLLHVLLWCAGIACVIGIAVYCLQPVNRFVGTFFDYRFQTDYWPNAWGDFFLLSWPLLVWLCFWQALRSLTVRVLSSIGLGIFLSCFLLSYSRGSILAFGLQLGLLAMLGGLFVLRPMLATAKRPNVLLNYLFPPQRFEHVSSAFLLGILIFGVALVGFQGTNVVRSHLFPVQSVVEKATFTAAEGTSSVDERTQFWRQSLALSLEKPVTGWGPYSFRFVQPRLQQGVFATSDHPHNVILKIAMERGWPAALIFLFLIGFVVWKGLQFLWSARHNSPQRTNALLVVVLLTAFLGTLAHSMIDYNLQFVANGLLFWIEGALIIGIARGAKAAETRVAETTASLLRQGKNLELLLAFLLLLAAMFEGWFLVTSSLGRHSEVAGDSKAALAWYEASRLEMFSRDMHLSRTHLLLDAKQPTMALQALDAYFTVNKQDARGWLLKAQALEAQGKFQEAMAAYDETLRLGKYNYAGALRGSIAMRLKLNDTNGMMQNIGEYEALTEAFTEAIMHNIHFIALTPNVESLGESLDLLSQFDPRHAANYQKMKQETMQHAKEERVRLQSRTPGLLW